LSVYGSDFLNAVRLKAFIPINPLRHIKKFNNMKIIAYMKPKCRCSHGIRAVLEKYALEYEEKDIVKDPDSFEEMIRKSNQRLSPCIEIDNVMLAKTSGEALEEYLLANNHIVYNDNTVQAATGGCGCGKKYKPHTQVNYSAPQISPKAIRFF